MLIDVADPKRGGRLQIRDGVCDVSDKETGRTSRPPRPTPLRESIYRTRVFCDKEVRHAFVRCKQHHPYQAMRPVEALEL
jgi:hypothetical protein